jgi:plasmid stabilization system protein ParE
MNRTLVVFEEASQEVEEQAAYYREHAGVHVASRFATAVERAYRKLAEGRAIGVNHPFVRYRRPIKRLLLDQFPFAVVFYQDDAEVFVVAVEALRRRPGYWRERLR